jgi:DNA adenine methylase
VTLRAPFPWFGGKWWIAADVWERFGDVPNYVEPFFGSGAMLLARPRPGRTETANDADGFVANFWRALQSEPDEVARHADWPVNENDLHARHAWLVGERDRLTARLEGSPDYYDARIAGWWVWGISAWIGSGFCSGAGPWRVIDGELCDTRKRPHLGNAGRGVNRQLPHLGNAGRGVNRQLPHLGDAGRGELRAYLRALADRLARVRVCSGDWSRVCGPSVTHKHGLTAVFLDPPYAEEAERAERLYRVDSPSVARDVREWAVREGANPLMRIALCGYEGEHEMPDEWECFEWKARGGFASQAREQSGNRHRERVWFSPHCIGRRQAGLFGRELAEVAP